MEEKIRVWESLIADGKKCFQDQNLFAALNYYKEAASILFTVFRSQLEGKLREQVSAPLTEAFGTMIKLKKEIASKCLNPHETANQDFTGITLVPYCAEFYKKLAEKFNSEVVAPVPRREFLQCVIEAFQTEATVKCAVLT